MSRIQGYPGLYREDFGKEGTRYRIVISRNQKRVQEYFFFGDRQTEARARAQAIRRWKELRASMPVMTRAAFARIERRKSRSGIVGVRRITKESRGHSYHFWVAVFSDRRGNKKWRSFSVDKYGAAKAKKLAIRARRKGLAQMDG
jgi:hypothetical protein